MNSTSSHRKVMQKCHLAQLLHPDSNLNLVSACKLVAVLATVSFALPHTHTVSAVDSPDRPTTARDNFRFNFPFGFSAPAPPPPPAPPQPPAPPAPFRPGDEVSNSGENSDSSDSSLVWQPLALRSTFRPLNRQTNRRSSPPLAEPSAGSSEPSAESTSERLIPIASSDQSPGASSFRPSGRPAPVESSTVAPATSSQPTSSGPDDDDVPTRLPSSRFRPTRAPPSDDDQGADSASSNSIFPSAGGATSGANQPATGNSSSQTASERISSECFECICEASTSCNSNSRCQTSDVRHTRCGMFLISYDQWLATELSKQLVSAEALANDPAADERSFYDCVTQRDCAERLLAIYFQRTRKDCDRDGRIDCYDLAAIHHSGMEQCASEQLLDSQYWTDFNACFGFGA